ncbi:hemolysin-III related-domain-containing protein [Xylariomycetidae sp. FL0641]|nr:hemolysin-III related-domain-containing protein [Xylariomycetidae sp. FL0641]
MPSRTGARRRLKPQSIRTQCPSINDPPGTEGRLLQWSELPEWRRDNEYILSGYQPTSNSFRGCLRGVFAVHNETVNIHTHLLGAALFAGLLLCVPRHLDRVCPGADATDEAAFAVYFAGVVACLLLSTAFHALANHSRRVAAVGNQLDHLGVLAFMGAAAAPQVHYGFRDEPGLRGFYWTTVGTLSTYLLTYLVCSRVVFSAPPLASAHHRAD